MVQVNNSPITLRVKFYKKDSLKYISHLDLVRTMMKIIVRAGLPLWYTEGFNPKPKLTFALPLSTGVESECEYMDIRLTEKMDTGEALDRLNRNMTAQMQATEAYYPKTKLSELALIDYEILLDLMDTRGVSEKINALFSEQSLVVAKKTKSGISDTDIKPLIKKIYAEDIDGGIKISALLSAYQSSFLNPEYIIQLLRARLGVLSEENLIKEGYTVKRCKAYFENMEIFH